MIDDKLLDEWEELYRNVIVFVKNPEDDETAVAAQKRWLAINLEILRLARLGLWAEKEAKPALENIREGNALMAEGEGADTEDYMDMARHWMNEGDKALASYPGTKEEKCRT